MKKLIAAMLLLAMLCMGTALAQEDLITKGLDGESEWLVWQDFSWMPDPYMFLSMGTLGQPCRTCEIRMDENGHAYMVSFFVFEDGQIEEVYLYGANGVYAKTELENGATQRMIRRAGDEAVELLFENEQPVAQNMIDVASLEGTPFEAAYVQVRDYEIESGNGATSRLIQVTEEDSLVTLLLCRLGSDGSFEWYESIDGDVTFSYTAGNDYYVESSERGVYYIYGDGTAILQAQ